jgi:signal transduction histidine kinase
MFYAGNDLGEIFSEANKLRGSLNYLNLKVPLNQINVLMQVIYHLEGGADEPEILTGEYYNEEEELKHMLDVKDKASANNLFVYKMIMAFLFNENEKGYEIACRGREYVKEAKGIYPSSVYFLFESLLIMSMVSSSKSNKNRRLIKKVKNNLRKFEKWAKACPENFENKYFLIKAEIERRKNNILNAGELYDKSITAAHQNGLVHEQAIACELAGEFWLKNGKEDFARIYLNNAYKYYNIWGASGKVRSLEEKHDSLIFTTNRQITDSGYTVGSHSATGLARLPEIIDLETILEAAKAISSEIYYSSLVKKSLTIILEHAGAQKGVLLINNNDDELQTEAVGKIIEGNIQVTLDNNEVNLVTLPKSVINYVKRSNSTVILHNAKNEGDYLQDQYIIDHNVKSLIAIPILHQSKFIGVLYLENNLSVKVFDSEKVEILSILCTQIAISLENAVLYNSLERKVDERTKELSLKNKLLQQQNGKIEKAHQQLEELNATKDKFFSIIAHDLRGPVGNINSFFELLIDKVEGHNIEGMDQLIAAFHNTSKYTYKLLNNLLDWARTQRNEIEYIPKLQSVNELVDSNISLIINRAKSKQVRLVNKMVYEVLGYFDSNLIDTVLRNLMDNALKYVNQGDSITVSSKETGDKVIISVIDTGVGMSKSDCNRLFNVGPVQKTKLGTEGEKGTGLGLLLCKEFVSKNGGEIWVEGEEGKGCIFSFSIPRSQKDAVY